MKRNRAKNNQVNINTYTNCNISPINKIILTKLSTSTNLSRQPSSNRLNASRDSPPRKVSIPAANINHQLYNNYMKFKDSLISKNNQSRNYINANKTDHRIGCLKTQIDNEMKFDFDRNETIEYERENLFARLNQEKEIVKKLKMELQKVCAENIKEKNKMKQNYYEEKAKYQDIFIKSQEELKEAIDEAKNYNNMFHEISSSFLDITLITYSFIEEIFKGYSIEDNPDILFNFVSNILIKLKNTLISKSKIDISSIYEKLKNMQKKIEEKSRMISRQMQNKSLKSVSIGKSSSNELEKIEEVQEIDYLTNEENLNISEEICKINEIEILQNNINKNNLKILNESNTGKIKEKSSVQMNENKSSSINNTKEEYSNICLNLNLENDKKQKSSQVSKENKASVNLSALVEKRAEPGKLLVFPGKSSIQNCSKIEPSIS